MKINEETYKYKWQVKQNNDRRQTKASVDGFYKSAKWLKLRQYKLSLNPLCEYCEKRGRLNRAKIIDHIEPIIDGNDELALDLDNLQSLCYYHHQRKTSLDNSKYNPKNLRQGKEIQNNLNDFD